MQQTRSLRLSPPHFSKVVYALHEITKIRINNYNQNFCNKLSGQLATTQELALPLHYTQVYTIVSHYFFASRMYTVGCSDVLWNGFYLHSNKVCGGLGVKKLYQTVDIFMTLDTSQVCHHKEWIRAVFDVTAVCAVPGLGGEEDLADQYHNDKTPEHSNSNHKKWNPTDFDTFGGYM